MVLPLLFIFRVQGTEHLLTNILCTLNKIWNQSDWQDKYMCYTYCLSGLLANYQFRRTVCSLVKSFENLLGNRILESAGFGVEPSVSADNVYFSTLPKLMLPLILRVNSYLQHFVSWHLLTLICANTLESARTHGLIYAQTDQTGYGDRSDRFYRERLEKLKPWAR